jgi:hypothetical protein
MTVHQLARMVATGVALLALAAPAGAQRRDSSERGDTGRTAAPRGGTTDDAGAGRSSPAQERAAERQAERQELREARSRDRVEAIAERSQARERPTVVESPPVAAPAGGSRDNRPGNSPDGGPNRNGDRDDDRDRREDSERREERSRDWDRDRDRDRWRDEDTSVPGAITINPITIGGLTVGTTRIGKPGTIGQRVVIGQVIPDSAAKAPSGRGYPVIVLAPGEPLLIDDGVVDVGTPAPVYDAPQIVGGPQVWLPDEPAIGDAYYVFRVWYPLTERITAGYPVPYPAMYANTYEKVGLPADGVIPDVGALAPQAREVLESGVALVPFREGTFGGVSFEVLPPDTGVYVDGVYAGLAEEYSPLTPPLPLLSGPHEIELRAPGHRTERFEIVITRGEVTPIAGSLALFAR